MEVNFCHVILSLRHWVRCEMGLVLFQFQVFNLGYPEHHPMISSTCQVSPQSNFMLWMVETVTILKKQLFTGKYIMLQIRLLSGENEENPWGVINSSCWKDIVILVMSWIFIEN